MKKCKIIYYTRHVFDNLQDVSWFISTINVISDELVTSYHISTASQSSNGIKSFVTGITVEYEVNEKDVNQLLNELNNCDLTITSSYFDARITEELNN